MNNTKNILNDEKTVTVFQIEEQLLPYDSNIITDEIIHLLLKYKQISYDEVEYLLSKTLEKIKNLPYLTIMSNYLQGTDNLKV